MCPPGPFPSSDIGTYWTDEELIELLVRIQHGSPLPSNVLGDVNPFEYKPSNLPRDVWFFVYHENQKETEIDFWKTKGEGCQIYSDSKLTGWRTTLEFYEGQSNDGHKTDWVMQKYWIRQKGSNNSKSSGSLCRVFSCDGGCRKQKRQRQESSPLEDHNICNQNEPAKNAQVIVQHGETKSSDPPVNQDDMDCFSRGDYLELLDLVNPRPSSSSSDNSSSLSMSSDEVFDYLTLLNDLEPENCKETQSKSGSCNLSVMASSIPNEVVLPPAINGTLLNGDGNRSPVNAVEVEHSLPGPVSEENSHCKDGIIHAGKAVEVEHSLPGPVSEETSHRNDGIIHAGKAVKVEHSLPGPVSEESSYSKDGIIHAGRNGEDEKQNTSGASTSQSLVPDKRKKRALGKMTLLRKKYLCFMPF